MGIFMGGGGGGHFFYDRPTELICHSMGIDIHRA